MPQQTVPHIEIVPLGIIRRQCSIIIDHNTSESLKKIPSKLSSNFVVKMLRKNKMQFRSTSSSTVNYFKCDANDLKSAII